MHKCSGLKKSLVPLNFFKSCLRHIKELCSENLHEFKYVKIVSNKPIIHNVLKWSDRLSK